MDIVSIHIPKTAGTSFRKLLEKNYANAVELVYEGERSRTFLDKKYYRCRKGTRVIHGHFPVFPDLKKYYPGSKLITWIRDPIDRLISHYYFFKSYPRHGNKAQDLMLDQDLSLVDFARLPFEGEIFVYKAYLKYLQEVRFEDFWFIGIVEEFDHHLEILANALGWNYLDKFFERKSDNRMQPTPGELSALRKILSEEIWFYETIREKVRKRNAAIG